MMKKIFYLLLLAGTAGISGQDISDALFERIYLQTDKQLYLAGELVYMKVFTVTPEKEPLSFSKIVYVELLDEENSRVQVKIELANGVGDGWMELPLNLPTAYYRLLAYTRFMRNETESVFFGKNIAVVNTFQPNQIRIEPTDQTSDIIEPQTCSLRMDKPLYAHREKGFLKIEGLPENIHTLSVSIAGKSPASIHGNPINQWEQQIKQPSAIHLLEQYLPEYEGHIITGKIIPVQTSDSSTDKTLIPLLSFPGEKFYLFEGQKKEDMVLFYTAHSSGIRELVTTASTDSENLYRIDIQSPFVEKHVKKQLPVLKIDSAYLDDLLERSVALQALHSYTKDSVRWFRSGDHRFDMKPAHTYILDEYTRFVVMNELIAECISQLRFRRNNQRKQELFLAVKNGEEQIWTRPLVVLDGIPVLDHDVIYRYDPLLVERINIYQGTPVYGGLMFDGIVELLTYAHNYPGLSVNQSTQIVGYAGAQTPRRLYSPDYSNEENRKSRLPDFRHTLLWEPTLPANGQSALEIPFYTSDCKGEFLVTVEGLTHKGEIIAATTTIEVQ